MERIRTATILSIFTVGATSWSRLGNPPKRWLSHALPSAICVLQSSFLFLLACGPRTETKSDWGWIAGLKRLDGTGYTQAGMGDKPLVLFFLSGWSSPCEPMAVELSAPAGRARVIGVVSDPSDLKDSDGKTSIEFALSEDHAVHEHFGVSVLPTVLVLNAQGRPVYRLEGYRPGAGSEVLTHVDSLVRATRDRR